MSNAITANAVSTNTARNTAIKSKSAQIDSDKLRDFRRNTVNSHTLRVALIAKPWLGGLDRYYAAAFDALCPGSVELISTRPKGFTFRPRLSDTDSWWDRLGRRIEAGEHDLRLFIGFERRLRLRPDSRNILYLTDDASVESTILDKFSKIFLSDPGYADELRSKIPEHKFGGVLPFACLPACHAQVRHDGTLRPVCFIGSPDKERDRYLQTLLDQGPTPTIVGDYFLSRHPLFYRRPLNFRPRVRCDRMGHVYARHRVSLNIHAAVLREGTNMRTFEAAACGIAQVVEQRAGIEAYFAPGEEILTFETPEEMREQIIHLNSDTALAHELSTAARKRALAEHTYQHRVAKILNTLGLQVGESAQFRSRLRRAT